MEANASMIDPVHDPDLDSDPFFGSVQKSLLRNRPIPILPMRHQGPTYACYSHALTAVMYGDEVSRKGSSVQCSRQELLDNIHKHRRPKWEKKTLGPFTVLDSGFPCSYPVAFGYAKKRGLSPDADYPWVGKVNCNTYDGTEWDGTIMVGDKPIDAESKIYIRGHKRLTTDDEIEFYLEKQPVAGCIMLTESLHTWSSEKIYTGVDAGKNIEQHAITLVGYGKEGDTHYYLCQNSYGLKWGHRGYFKAARHLITRAYVPLETKSPIQREKMNDEAPDDTADIDEDMGSHALKKRRFT